MTAAPTVRYIVHPSVGSSREDVAAALDVAAVEAKALASPESARLCAVYVIVARAIGRSKRKYGSPEPAVALAATCTISVGALRYPTIVLPRGGCVDDGVNGACTDGPADSCDGNALSFVPACACAASLSLAVLAPSSGMSSGMGGATDDGVWSRDASTDDGLVASQTCRSIASLCATITASPRFIAAAAKAAPVFTVAISAVPLPKREAKEKGKAGAASSSSFEPALVEKKTTESISYSEELRDAPLVDRCRYAAATAALALKTARWARGNPEVVDSHSFRTVQGTDVPLRRLLRVANVLCEADAEWMLRLFTEAANGSPCVSIQNGRISPLTLPPPPSDDVNSLQEGIFSIFLGRFWS